MPPTPSELLAQTTLFSALPPQHQEQIAARMTRHEIAPNAPIVRQGEPADALFLIEAGLVGEGEDASGGDGARAIALVDAHAQRGSLSRKGTAHEAAA